MEFLGEPKGEAAKLTDVVNDREGPAFLTSYAPLNHLAVRKEVETFQEVSAASLEEWHSEVSMYEETFNKLDAATSKTVEFPRRNYPNDECQVKDTNLYPYHDACYPLIDAYSREESRGPSVLEWRVPGQLLTPVPSISTVISGFAHYERLSGEYPPTLYLAGALEEEWKLGLARRLAPSGNYDGCERLLERIDSFFASKHSHGPAHFPIEDEARGDILLKLLRHAMSDLQNDLLLAGDVLIRMCRWNLVQNASYLGRVLAIVVSEAKECKNGSCFSLIWDDLLGGSPDNAILPDHSCKDWLSFRKKLSYMISIGIQYFTVEHAQVIAAVMQAHFDEANPFTAKLEAAAIEAALNPATNQSPQEQNRVRLKQKLFMSNNTYFHENVDDSDDDDEENEDSPEEEDWTDDIVSGLAANGILARRRVMEILDMMHQQTDIDYDPDALVLLLERSIDSFHNITSCLVSIGEASIRRLPQNPKAVGWSSRLVFGLTWLFLEPKVSTFNRESVDIRTYYKGGLSMIDPNRYADSVLNATKNYRHRHFPETRPLEVCSDAYKRAIETAARFLCAVPDQDVQDLVWCLFSRGLVDPVVSRAGYGDIQVWWGLPVTPLDPFLFFNSCNSPSDSAIESELTVAWETDEEGKELWGDELLARYDLSLLMLICAWQAPWTTDSHHSFQRPFRDAVRTLFLCANRMHMPTDIAAHICTYLHRDWWPDERRRCFDEDCTEKSSLKLIQQKLLSNVAGNIASESKRNDILRLHKSFIRCQDCRVASYCAEGHRQNNYRDGHKVVCAKPPCRLPGLKEKLLFQEILSLEDDETTPRVLNDRVRRLMESQLPRETNLDDDDDDGSWESVDSDDDDDEPEGNESFTSVVHAFFEKECYKSQRIDDE